MEFASKLLNPAFGFLLTVVFGFWLSQRGRPYHGLLFNVHKLIALGTVVLTILAIYQVIEALDPAPAFILLLLIAAVIVIGLFASGALMSANKGEYRVMKAVHNIAPFVLLIDMGYIVYSLTLR